MTPSGRIVRFGIFELDAEARELRKNGVKVKLQDQPFEILTILLERRGEIATRDELRARLWPEGTFVDFDHSLNASMNKLRDALGDSASNPRFVETIPRRGYRFIAPAEVMEPAAALPAAAVPRKSSSKKKYIAAAAAAMLTLTAAGIATRWNLSPPAESSFDVVPLTTAMGLELQPSFSPDGNYVVYTGQSRPDGNWDLYVKQIGSESSRLLTSGKRSDISPKWSPDSRSIAFVRVFGQGRRAEAAVMTVPALGGVERAVPEGQIRVQADDMNSFLLDWCADSEHLVVADQSAASASATAALVVLNTRTGERQQLTSPPDGGWGDLDPAVSPDGRRLAFTRYTGSNASPLIYLLDWDEEFRGTGEPRAQPIGRGSRGAAWMPDGQEIIFAYGPHHRKRLMRIRVDAGSSPRPLPFAAEGVFGLMPAVSRKNQLAYPRFHGDTSIYRVELTPQGRQARTAEFLASSFIDHQPRYSPDGAHIAFVSNRSGVQEIWVSKADGSDPHPVTSFRGEPEVTWPRWSPDGRRLVVSGGHAAYVLDTLGGAPRMLLKENVGERPSHWSPDGKWIYVSSHRTGRDEVWKVPADPGAGEGRDVQITKNGGGAPQVSPDGAYVYYAKRKSPAELWRIPAAGGPEERVIEKLANDDTFTVTSAGIYFIPPRDQESATSLMFLQSPGRPPRIVAPVTGDPMWGLTVSPDGRFILYVGLNSPDSDLMLVNNFR